MLAQACDAHLCDAHPWALWCAGKGYLLRMSDHASYQRRLKEERDARLAGEKRIAQLESQVADLTKELRLTKGREKGLLRMLDKLAARDAETHVPTNEWLGDGPALAQDVRRLLESGESQDEGSQADDSNDNEGQLSATQPQMWVGNPRASHSEMRKLQDRLKEKAEERHAAEFYREMSAAKPLD